MRHLPFHQQGGSPNVDLAVGALIVERLLVKGHGALEGSAGEDQRTWSKALDQPVPYCLLAGAELDDGHRRGNGVCRVVNDRRRHKKGDCRTVIARSIRPPVAITPPPIPVVVMTVEAGTIEVRAAKTRAVEIGTIEVRTAVAIIPCRRGSNRRTEDDEGTEHGTGHYGRELRLHSSSGSKKRAPSTRLPLKIRMRPTRCNSGRTR